MLTRAEITRQVLARPGLMDVHSHIGMDPSHLFTNAYPYAMSVEDQALRARLLGIDYTVSFPFLYTRYFALLPFTQGRFEDAHDAGCPFPYKVENERLLTELYDVFPRYAGQLLPFAFFDPGRLQAEQAAWLAELAQRFPLFGLKTATSYLHSYLGELLGAGRPLLDLAAKLDLPVMLHTAVLPGDPWGDVFALLKVVAARPDVRFCLAHTCRFDRRALDAAAALPNAWIDVSAFNIHLQLAWVDHPAIAAPAHRFATNYRDHAAALGAFAEAYPDRLLWATDTPYHYFMSQFFNDQGERVTMHLKCDYETEVAELRKLPAATIRRIGTTNSLRFLFGAAARG
jgi:predicted TIM-barrel fold metal-dependent hydrolase